MGKLILILLWHASLGVHSVKRTHHCANARREMDAKIFTASPLENWRWPPGHSHTTWMKTIQQDLKSN